MVGGNDGAVEVGAVGDGRKDEEEIWKEVDEEMVSSGGARGSKEVDDAVPRRALPTQGQAPRSISYPLLGPCP